VRNVSRFHANGGYGSGGDGVTELLVYDEDMAVREVDRTE